MRPRTLIDFARVKPLTAWSVSGAALGASLAIYLTGWHIIRPFPMFIACISIVLMQYLAHPLNDILDYDLDRQAPIDDTGRTKPLVNGDITVEGTKRLSTALGVMILLCLAYLIYIQPLLIIPAIYGMVVVIGYSHPRLRFAYRPFTELYIGIPINVLEVFVIAYIGSGQLTLVAVLVGVVFAFASSTFFVSMMSMDFPTDRLNDKRTTIVAFPELKWCTYFPLAGLVLGMISVFFLVPEIGLFAASFFGIISFVIFVFLVDYGSKVDHTRLEYLNGRIDDPEARTGYIRLRQLYLSVIYATIIAAFFVVLGV